eukprot:TRINITY_DN9103_c0_g1_i1.p1 TRINITY_DN9103_c0_g1~~TRINITY_DN9103_c0_g1_i1.p1  ORF type:complete len:303 (-),score=68.53 TRINITY_DN9103_c0_g1_i1:22-930(-)
MSYPIDLVLVRHGESEGNLAQAFSMKGDNRFWTPEFHKRHTSRYRLTDLGIEQAVCAGNWIKENISDNFDRFYVSEYVRAKETAAYLGFENSEWLSEFFLREQDMGLLQGLSKTERKEKYGDILKVKELDAYYFQPPGGESIANVCLRVERWLSDLKRQSSGMRVVCVCHGNILKALRIRIEKIKQQDWHGLGESWNATQNCQIIHYTRRNPWTGKVHNDIRYMRSICPWDTRLSPNEWVEINRPTFSNADLLESVQKVPRLVTNLEGDNLEALQSRDHQQVRYPTKENLSDEDSREYYEYE